jgi:CO/xanthine dehydrogenase Mo-binding subunit
LQVVETKLTPKSLIGQPLERKDALDKVTGKTKFAADLSLPNMLHGAVVTSPYAHAKVIRVDTSKVPADIVVVTADDVPDSRKGQLYQDRPIITRIARFVGDVVAAVAAESEALARRGAALVKVEFEELPAVFDLEEAFSTNPPTIIHEDIDSYRIASTGHPLIEKGSPFKIGRDRSRPNVYGMMRVEMGDVETALSSADRVFENSFTTSQMQHAPMETHVAIADVDPFTGYVTVYSASQSPYRAKMELCELFDLPPSKVRFVNPPVGGSVGNKSYLTIEDLAVALSMKAKRPVKLVLPRSVDFTSTTDRNGSRVTIKDGFTKDGKLQAREITLLFDAGAYNDATMKFIASSVYAGASSYKIPNYRHTCYAVYTNRQPFGAYRGFSCTEVEWAAERQMDMVAEQLGISPVEIRRKNIIRDNINSVNEDMIEVRIGECLDKVVEVVDHWQQTELPNPNGTVRRGFGIAVANQGINSHKTSMTLKLHFDGQLELRLGSNENGAGSTSGLAQIVANEFKVPFEKVEVVYGDTNISPYDEGTTGSRAIVQNGSACMILCREFKKDILALASKLMNCPAEELEIANGKIFRVTEQEKSMDVSELFVKTQFGSGTMAKERGELIKTVTYDLKTIIGNRPIYHQSYTVGAQGVEAEVDLETGQVNVLRIVNAVDIGKAINSQSVENQINGATLHGLGTALYEEVKLADDGRMLNSSFMDYKIPTVYEQPFVQNIIVESEGNFGPYGAKSIGQYPLIATGPAIGSAVSNAIGIQLTHLPMTRERVLSAIESKREGS